ncbi:MAG: hypothetical protein ACOCXQ_01765 [Patescibacteria group bacterium]
MSQLVEISHIRKNQEKAHPDELYSQVSKELLWQQIEAELREEITRLEEDAPKFEAFCQNPTNHHPEFPEANNSITAARSCDAETIQNIAEAMDMASVWASIYSPGQKMNTVRRPNGKTQATQSEMPILYAHDLQNDSLDPKAIPYDLETPKRAAAAVYLIMKEGNNALFSQSGCHYALQTAAITNSEVRPDGSATVSLFYSRFGDEGNEHLDEFITYCSKIKKAFPDASHADIVLRDAEGRIVEDVDQVEEIEITLIDNQENSNKTSEGIVHIYHRHMPRSSVVPFIELPHNGEQHQYMVQIAGNRPSAKHQTFEGRKDSFNLLRGQGALFQRLGNGTERLPLQMYLQEEIFDAREDIVKETPNRYNPPELVSLRRFLGDMLNHDQNYVVAGGKVRTLSLGAALGIKMVRDAVESGKDPQSVMEAVQAAEEMFGLLNASIHSSGTLEEIQSELLQRAPDIDHKIPSMSLSQELERTVKRWQKHFTNERTYPDQRIEVSLDMSQFQDHKDVLVLGYPEIWQAIFKNLIVNAERSNSDLRNMKIVIGAEKVELPIARHMEHLLRDYPSGRASFARIFVRNTGAHMTPEQISRYNRTDVERVDPSSITGLRGEFLKILKNIAPIISRTPWMTEEEISPFQVHNLTPDEFEGSTGVEVSVLAPQTSMKRVQRRLINQNDEDPYQ